MVTISPQWILSTRDQRDSTGDSTGICLPGRGVRRRKHDFRTGRQLVVSRVVCFVADGTGV
ncbi:MAG: hypothetical protein V1903_14020 [Bacteroidota bacterium]